MGIHARGQHRGGGPCPFCRTKIAQLVTIDRRYPLYNAEGNVLFRVTGPNLCDVGVKPNLGAVPEAAAAGDDVDDDETAAGDEASSSDDDGTAAGDESSDDVDEFLAAADADSTDGAPSDADENDLGVREDARLEVTHPPLPCVASY